MEVLLLGFHYKHKICLHFDGSNSDVNMDLDQGNDHHNIETKTLTMNFLLYKDGGNEVPFLQSF